MASNAQKFPFGRALNQAAQKRALSAIQVLGKALPAQVEAVSGSIVTVSFQLQSAPWTLPQVTCPLFGPEYIRYPIQPGCKGVVFPADASLGGVSGLGSGTANIFAMPANLSALVFFPVGNANWSAPDDPNAVGIYGPNGAVIRDTGKKCVLTIKPSGATISGDCGDLTVTGNLSAGNGVTGAFTDPTGQIITVQNGIVTNIF